MEDAKEFPKCRAIAERRHALNTAYHFVNVRAKMESIMARLRRITRDPMRF